MVQKVKANKRKPEDATPWAELKDGVLAANAKAQKAVVTPNKKVLDERQKNYEKFLSDDIKNNTTFDTLKDNKAKKGAPVVAKKQPQNSSSEDDSSDDEEEQVAAVKPTPVKNGKANGKAPVQAEESSSEDDSDSDEEETAPPPSKQAKVTPNGKANGKAAAAKGNLLTFLFVSHF